MMQGLLKYGEMKDVFEILNPKFFKTGAKSFEVTKFLKKN